LLGWICGQHDLGMEQSAGNAGGNGYQFPLAAENFYLAGSRKFWEVDGAAVADVGSGFFICGYGWKLRQKFAGMDEDFIQQTSARGGIGFVEGVSIG
jgi:hypothetical protein